MGDSANRHTDLIFKQPLKVVAFDLRTIKVGNGFKPFHTLRKLTDSLQF
jgi:hypothetical protein